MLRPVSIATLVLMTAFVGLVAGAPAATANHSWCPNNGGPGIVNGLRDGEVSGWSVQVPNNAGRITVTSLNGYVSYSIVPLGNCQAHICQGSLGLGGKAYCYQGFGNFNVIVKGGCCPAGGVSYFRIAVE